ncbi:hypothetical protein GCM10023321_82020 [Pseudonocardia eucalypti]|uniref:DUF559 domain-containing protein n=1 Tax=Pseudonocardia eucalypti TaxID=648755 RepID=A0ABP9REB6_9PSEU|nr:very-short-patch-repair endonuclease [Pseudonocardia eucalypti]
MFDEPFRGSDAVRSGLLTRNQLFGPRYRRLYPDVYVRADRLPDLALRSRAAFVLVADRGGALAGYSAAELLGASCAPRDAPAEVLVPRDVRPHPGLLVSRGKIEPADVTSAAGCRVTAAERTAWDLARRPPLVEAVVAVDALARVGGFSPAVLLDRRKAAPRARGVRQLGEAVALADPAAESPMETRLRVALVLGRLPAPKAQHVIRDEHGFPLARADLAYPDARLDIEYDGAKHYDRLQHLRDRDRDSLLAIHGWETLRVDAHGMGTGILRTVQEVHRLLVPRAPERYGGIEIDRSLVDFMIESDSGRFRGFVGGRG